MKIMILGANGFLGGHVTKRLLDSDHEVICAARHPEDILDKFPNANVMACDFLEDTTPAIWLPRLHGVDVLINCVGIFYHVNKAVIWTLHYLTPKAIYTAAEKQQVKKIIHISALGIEPYDTEYARSKLAAEEWLKTLTIPACVLRPSFIYGQGARGGMALMASLASLPIVPLPGHGEQCLQPIHIDDLSEAVHHLVDKPLSRFEILAAVSSQEISIKSLLLTLRHWLRLKPTLFLPLPLWLLNSIAWFGNFSSKSRINSAALQMLEKGNTASRDEVQQFEHTSGIKPKSFAEGLQKTPSTPWDRLSAQFLVLTPLLRLSLALMWIVSALTSSLYGQEHSYALLSDLGIPPAGQSILLYGAATLNALIGIALLLHVKTRFFCWVQMAVILAYTFIISMGLPYLWLEPFGPVVKNIPILAGIMILYALERD
ncbi:SDR family oxidoreductase [Legionella erythra]|uniref:Oxidoreductase n=1 Tax=Legionella erythra TaxID=448 RepID=A0A0W0TVK3_LEGER|nr:SDR family oxidoreductase [Legionella erythra]KTC99416.1 oxidoreductase [Legionella erythra]